MREVELWQPIPRAGELLLAALLNVLTSPPILAVMAKKPEPPAPITWDVFKIASKAAWLATVEATDEHDAIEKVAKERNVPAARLLATRRR